MHGRQFNFWIAFADIVFMLFISILVVAAHSQERVNEAEVETKRLEEKNRALQAQMESLFQCRGADPLLTAFSSCVERKFGRGKAVKNNACAVTVGENLIQFAPDSDAPIRPDDARAAVRCLFDTTSAFADASPAAFQQVQTIHIDGFTDCEGQVRHNALLGAQRSLRLYGMLLDEMQRRFDGDTRRRDVLLAKFAVRSFGQMRPVAGSRCAELGRYADDRRVTISIDMKPEAGDQPGSRKVQN